MDWKWFGVIVPVVIILVLVIFAAFPIGITIEKRNVGAVLYNSIFSDCTKKSALQVITVKNSFLFDKIVSLPKYNACPSPYEKIEYSRSSYIQSDLNVFVFSNMRATTSLTVSPKQDSVAEVVVQGLCNLNKEYEFDEILLFEEKVDCSKLTDSQKSSAMRIKVVR